MDTIESTFNARFAPWDITLPPDSIKTRTRGKIVQAGWAIWYLFGKDEAGEFLDYYAAHRMTCDSHVRLRQDGSREALSAIVGWRHVSKNPVEDAQIKMEHATKNAEVAAILEEKGFGMRGDEPLSVELNRYLALKPDDSPRSVSK